MKNKIEIEKMKQFVNEKNLNMINDIKWNAKKDSYEIVYKGSSLYYADEKLAWDLLNVSVES